MVSKAKHHQTVLLNELAFCLINRIGWQHTSRATASPTRGRGRRGSVLTPIECWLIREDQIQLRLRGLLQNLQRCHRGGRDASHRKICIASLEAVEATLRPGPAQFVLNLPNYLFGRYLSGPRDGELCREETSRCAIGGEQRKLSS